MGSFDNFVYTPDFDKEFQYSGKDLGASCTEEGTGFKAWSPLAERMVLRLYEDGVKEAYATEEMKRDAAGIWQWKTDACLHGAYYDYAVWFDGNMIETADPYAVSCSCNGARSMVLNLRRTDPVGFSEEKPPRLGMESIIYELHIKDFSYDADSGVPAKYRGKFKAFTLSGRGEECPVCMEHLKSLGVTHVQLLPFFDYGALDEAGDDRQFNWGYDPVNYNVPEGSYATDVMDGAVRVRECKEMIQALHENGIRVVMDVVYNHTYRADSWLQRMAPGYYYRKLSDGSLSDGSACGNDIAAGRAMVDNYIADSVMYWAREYHVDGFRFDLMGLLTVELMNRIRRELDEAFGKGEKLLYGEPWAADSSPMEAGTRAALKDNLRYLDQGVAVFCDDTRDVIKGDVFIKEIPGFVNGGERMEKKLLGAVCGWRRGGGGVLPRSCGQIVNYVSAHDNFTLWDKLVLTMRNKEISCDEDYLKGSEDLLSANRLAAFIYFTCQGYPFFQAGEEFGRTKFGDGNSYRSAPEINMLRWKQAQRRRNLVEYYRGLIALRKQLPGLCDKSPLASERILEPKVLGESLVSFKVDNRGGNTEWSELLIVYNGSDRDYEQKVPEGTWEILVEGGEANIRRALTGNGESIAVKACSGIMLGRKAVKVKRRALRQAEKDFEREESVL